MIKANTLEPFIEVDNALNKLKMDDLVQEILDDVGEYLILRGYITKADKDLLETPKNFVHKSLKLTFKIKKCKTFLVKSKIEF